MDGMTKGSLTQAGWAEAASHPSAPATVLLSRVLLGLATGGSLATAGEPAPTCEAGRRVYVTGIVGSSLGGDAGPSGKGWIGDLASPTVGGDAAIGVAVDRSQSFLKGATRLEFEGRTRSRSAAGVESSASDPSTMNRSTTNLSTTSWSTMANVWRDVPITDHLGLYAGGGVGAGGGRSAAGESRSEFTWQAGGGATYALNNRLSLDVGYRALPAAFGAGATPDAPAGELLFSVRLYEPFRGWLRD